MAIVLAVLAMSRDYERGVPQGETPSAMPACTGTLDVTRYLRCAEAACQAAVRARLPAASRAGAVFGAAERVDHADLRFVRLVGALETPGFEPVGLTRGYECELEGLSVARARVIN